MVTISKDNFDGLNKGFSIFARNPKMTSHSSAESRQFLTAPISSSLHERGHQCDRFIGYIAVGLGHGIIFLYDYTRKENNKTIFVKFLKKPNLFCQHHQTFHLRQRRQLSQHFTSPLF